MEKTVTDIWRQYRQGRDYLDSVNLFDRVQTCHNFINGDQWNGLKYSGERPPRLNILLPMMKSATALVGQNSMAINHTSMNYGEGRQRLLQVCRLLDINAARHWENMKMDNLVWQILQDAYIAGDSFLYFYADDSRRDKISGEVLDTTNIMLGDEQQPDIQKQPYILIVQRKSVDWAKRRAKKAGLSEEDINAILPDSDTRLRINGQNEVKNNRKLTVVAKLWKEKGSVYLARATKTVLLGEPVEIKGMKNYPIAKYTWKPRKGLARGDGDVWDKIPNQISINKSLFRLEQAVKGGAYPIKVYRQNAMTRGQAEKLNQPGASIALNGAADAPVTNVIGYLQPAAISPFAQSYWQDLINLTKELSGGGDNLENINPEQASGVAIQAVRDMKALNVNMQVAAYKQFIEDVALIWYELLAVYNPGGVKIYDEDGNSDFITPAELKGMKISVKIEVTPSDSAYTALKEYNLKQMLTGGFITFEEYVGALDDNGTLPKAEFEKIIRARKLRESRQSENRREESAPAGGLAEMLGGLAAVGGTDGGATMPILTEQ